jgi:hypothetical protein
LVQSCLLRLARARRGCCKKGKIASPSLSRRAKIRFVYDQGKLRDPNSSGLILQSAYLLTTFIFSNGPTEPIQPSLSIHDVKG